MARLEDFESFLVGQQITIDNSYLVIALLLSAVLAFVLAKIYIRYGLSLSNRRRFASTFMLLTMTTTLVIAIVKSSLALSLGLVGALSIVRFRAPIKEPEELVFLFLAIALGLGLGSGQVITTIIAFIVMIACILGRHFFQKKQEHQNLFVKVSGSKVSLKKLISILNSHCSSVNLRRFDDGKKTLEASFLVDFDSFHQLEKAKKDLDALSGDVSVTFLSALN